MIVGPGLEAEDRRADRSDRVVDVGDRAVQPLRGFGRGPAAGCFEGETNGEQALDHGVVEVTGDPLAFGDDVQLFGVAPGPCVGERHGGLGAEGL